MISIRQVREPGDAAIASFAALQREVYFDSDLLLPGELIPRLLGGDGGRHNLLLVAEEDGVVVAGTFFHYLAAPNCGFSSFLGVRAVARGRGVARRLHEARFAALDAAAGREVAGVFIDVTAPERVAPEAVEAERRFGFDPLHRRRVFQSLGFRRVDVRYEQPVGGPGGGPLTVLDLLFCPRDPATLAIPTALVLETMRAYWSPWLGERRTGRALAELAARAAGPTLALHDAS